MTTFLIGDYFFVSKYAYGYSRYTWPFSSSQSSGRIWGSEPARGDVVAFLLIYIKRVVGLPGDRIQMKQGLLHINGVPVARERLPDGRRSVRLGCADQDEAVACDGLLRLHPRQQETRHALSRRDQLGPVAMDSGPALRAPRNDVGREFVRTGERVWASKNPGIAAGVLHFVDR
jgi:Signal peptidase, peptidase S26